ncbi:MAG: DUF2911 domain-containing protein [Cellulophaga sp.]|nr:DUF2911 domain-containing protein [Cellulophaga sp.]
MKKLVLLLFMVSASFSLNAQITTPQPSPAATVKQVVGLTDVTLEYSRPAMRGRTIFGDLVPYNTLWRTGANKNSVITFSNDVIVGGKSLKAGSYAIFSTPGESVWEVTFYSDTENWGTPQNWDASKVAAIVKANPTKLAEKVESFTIAINHLSDNGAHLVISWGDTKVAIPFEVPTDATVTANINKVMNGAGAGDYYAAAVYYLSADKDISKAKEWMDKAMSLTEKPAYWQLRQQSLIYAKAGDKKGAIAAAKKSLAGAQEAKNMDYVKMNTDSLKEWGAM